MKTPTPRRDPKAAATVTARAATMALCLLLPLAWAPVASSEGAGCSRGPVNCTNNTAGTKRTCTATLQCSGAPTWSINQNGSMNVTTCMPNSSFIMGGTVTFNLVAIADTTSPVDRSCSWGYASPMRAAGGSVQITTADGLPVELMDFSIEDDSESVDDADESEDH